MRSSRSPNGYSSPGAGRSLMPNRLLRLALLALAVVLVPAADAGGRRVTLTLDWTPNPDHVGFYYARDSGLFAGAGLDVAIQAPSDPTAPLKLVALGRSDLAVSYEQELFFAAARKLPVVAVAAVVPQPLNSIMAIEPGIHGLADLKGKTIGITGVPSDYAALDTALGSAGLTRKDVKVVSVGYSLLPALLSHTVDAVLGVYRNVEGIQLQERGLKPTIIPLDRAALRYRLPCRHRTGTPPSGPRSGDPEEGDGFERPLPRPRHTGHPRPPHRPRRDRL